MQMENGGSELNDRLRRFDDQEKQRVKHAMIEHEEKSKRRLRSLRDKSLSTIKELEQIQNEKRKIVLESEQKKLAEYEEEYQGVLGDWQSQLKPRKLTLETKFLEELSEQEKFYGIDNDLSLSSNGSALKHQPAAHMVQERSPMN